jgi:hypothetical protein
VTIFALPKQEETNEFLMGQTAEQPFNEKEKATVFRLLLN